MDIELIEKRVDRAVAGAVTVSAEVGGVKFQTMMEMMEFAKLMAISGVAVPAHCRGQPGVCLAIVVQAQEWRMSPYAVARMSYMASDNLAYQSQLIHAVVEARAPLKGRLRHEIRGTGDERRCYVYGTFRGEDRPHEYLSEPLAKLREARGRNERGQIRGSPMWEAQPEVQLFYSASRTWARMHCPDVILGIYSIDELPEEPKDVTPLTKAEEFAQRLKAQKLKDAERKGFDADRVARDIAASSIIEGETATGEAQTEVTDDEPRSADVAVDSGRRTSFADDRGSNADVEGAGSGASGEDSSAGGEPAQRRQEDQANVFPPDRITSGPQDKTPVKR